MKVTQYVIDSNNAKKLQIDPERVAISGDSAGMYY
jgi:acetyl esterase/lipase